MDFIFNNDYTKLIDDLLFILNFIWFPSGIIFYAWPLGLFKRLYWIVPINGTYILIRIIIRILDMF